jgi:hypothetical protein
MFGVVAFCGSSVNRAQFGRHHAQLLRFQSTHDFTNETAFNTVGLDDDEGSLHEEQI